MHRTSVKNDRLNAAKDDATGRFLVAVIVVCAAGSMAMIAVIARAVFS